MVLCSLIIRSNQVIFFIRYYRFLSAGIVYKYMRDLVTQVVFNKDCANFIYFDIFAAILIREVVSVLTVQKAAG